MGVGWVGILFVVFLGVVGGLGVGWVGVMGFLGVVAGFRLFFLSTGSGPSMCALQC